MPTFHYQSLTTSGQTRQGTISATSRADALQQLSKRGETPTTIHASKRKARAAAATPTSHHPTMSKSAIATLIREIATAIEAGLPLMTALKTIRQQASGKGAPVILDHLIERVEAGDPLWKGAAEYGRPCDDMTVGMLRASEASGEMSKVLHQLADLMERTLELRREVTGALFYPALVFVLILISIAVLVTVLVPRLIEPMIATGNMELPWPTALLLDISDFIKMSWIWIIVGVALAVTVFRGWVKVPLNRIRFDRAKLQVPLVGRLLRDVAVARFTRTLGTLTASGLPILESLKITRDTLGNEALAHAIDEVQEQVTHGRSLAEPLERSGLFPAMLVQVVNLGERSGKLDEMLVHAATAFDRQVASSLKLLTKALPPFLIIFMAGLGGFVLAAILLPIMSLQSLVQ